MSEPQSDADRVVDALRSVEESNERLHRAIERAESNLLAAGALLAVGIATVVFVMAVAR